MKNVSVPLLVILAIHAVAGVEENSVRGLSNQSFFGSFDSKKAASGPGDRGKRRPGRGPIRKGKGGSDKGDDDDVSFLGYLAKLNMLDAHAFSISLTERRRRKWKQRWPRWQRRIWWR
jgi:hypothetical protein